VETSGSALRWGYGLRDVRTLFQNILTAGELTVVLGTYLISRTSSVDGKDSRCLYPHLAVQVLRRVLRGYVRELYAPGYPSPRSLTAFAAPGLALRSVRNRTSLMCSGLLSSCLDSRLRSSRIGRRAVGRG
jgi:hypothetical protein